MHVCRVGSDNHGHWYIDFSFYLCVGYVLYRSTLYDLLESDIFGEKNKLVWRYRIGALCRNCAFICCDKIQLVFSFVKTLTTTTESSNGN